MVTRRPAGMSCGTRGVISRGREDQCCRDGNEVCDRCFPCLQVAVRTCQSMFSAVEGWLPRLKPALPPTLAMPEPVIIGETGCHWLPVSHIRYLP